jgi:predicted HAD superfamily phosphohydrolase
MSEEEEDALLEEMDDLWWSLTEDEITKVNEYIKSIQNTQEDLELVDNVYPHD